MLLMLLFLLKFLSLPRSCLLFCFTAAAASLSASFAVGCGSCGVVYISDIFTLSMLAISRYEVPRTNKTEPCEAEKTIKKKKKEARKLASFKRHNSRKVLKKALKNRVRSNIKALRALKDKEKARAAEHPPADREGGSGDSGEASTSDMYEGYSLKHLPLATRPQD